MFKGVKNIFKKKANKQPIVVQEEEKKEINKDTAKERLHLVLVQDRANISADFIEMMRQEIIDVVNKYVDIDENEVKVNLENKKNNDGTVGNPSLYVTVPIVGIKDEARKYNKDLDKLQEESKKKQKEKEKEKAAKKAKEQEAQNDKSETNNNEENKES